MIIMVTSRRFRCGSVGCPRRVFVERFPEIAPPHARRTNRLAEIQRHVCLALGSASGARLARRLGLSVSGSTLLRLVCRGASSRGKSAPPLRAIGIDDWAWKRGHRYGSIVCDLERQCIVDLLPDHAGTTVEEWLSAHPGIEVIARDRGGAYGSAATRARPGAKQVADRWRLIENASAAFLDAVRRSMSRIRAAIGAATVDPALLTCAERRQHDGSLRRQEANAIIRRLAEAGAPIKEIVRRTGHSRKVVREVVRGGRTDVFRIRMTSLDGFLPHLEAAWAGGCRNGAELWRRLKAIGFHGAPRVVSEWATRRRRSESTPDMLPRKPPSARTLARLMSSPPDRLSTADTMLVAAVEKALPMLGVARDLAARLQTMLRSKSSAGRDAWLGDATGSLLAAFASGVAADRDAVEAAITEPWSNGQTEGQITKLKLVKRQMYGRAKLDLLRARLCAA
jgi:transposase